MLKIRELEGNGDFNSPECIELLQQADVVVTNPPFSLFRKFINLMFDNEKKFLVVGSETAISCKEIHPLFKDNKMWLGINHISTFVKPSGETQKFGNICWYSNIEHNKRNQPLDLTARYSPDKYPKYNNCDAIDIRKVKDIPCDYYGVMGVPLSFLGKYNPEQFEIIRFRKGDDGKDLTYEDKYPFTRILIKRKSDDCRN